MNRNAEHARISAMAGLDAEGGILPPPPGMSIDRTPSPWWRTRQYAEHAAQRLEAMGPLLPVETPLLARLRSSHARRAPHTHAREGRE